MKGEIAAFEQALEREGVQPSQGETPSTNEYQNLLEEMQAYNERLYESGQSGLTDAWSYEQAAFDLTSYGLSTEVMGVLRIPAMEQELPVYICGLSDSVRLMMERSGIVELLGEDHFYWSVERALHA